MLWNFCVLLWQTESLFMSGDGNTDARLNEHVFICHTYYTGPSHPLSQTWWSPLWRPPGSRCPSLRRRGLPPPHCWPSAPQPGGICLHSPEKERKTRLSVYCCFNMRAGAKKLLTQWVGRQRQWIKITRVNSLQLELCSQDEKLALRYQLGLRDRQTQARSLSEHR